ncbi:hypothetical protein ACFX5K_03765 [Rickettsiales bacterium LUAb2]
MKKYILITLTLLIAIKLNDGSTTLINENNIYNFPQWKDHTCDFYVKIDWAKTMHFYDLNQEACNKIIQYAK